ncbi:MAG: LysE family translocator [Paracoccaceae bacterium]
MSYEIFRALVALSIATLFTPGPNNAMLANSGATFGFRRSLPHLLGVALGFPVMVLIVGLVLGQLFQTSPLLREVMRWGGAALLLWIAVKMAFAGSAKAKAQLASPMGFGAASAFQWINPKAWSMAIAATSQFITPAAPVTTATIVAATFAGLGLISAATWVGLGQAISRWLTTEWRRRGFNITMALLIVLSMIDLLRH